MTSTARCATLRVSSVQYAISAPSAASSGHGCCPTRKTSATSPSFFRCVPALPQPSRQSRDLQHPFELEIDTVELEDARLRRRLAESGDAPQKGWSGG